MFTFSKRKKQNLVIMILSLSLLILYVAFCLDLFFDKPLKNTTATRNTKHEIHVTYHETEFSNERKKIDNIQRINCMGVPILIKSRVYDVFINKNEYVIYSSGSIKEKFSVAVSNILRLTLYPPGP